MERDRRVGWRVRIGSVHEQKREKQKLKSRLSEKRRNVLGTDEGWGSVRGL